MHILHAISGLPRAAGTSVFCGELANGLVNTGHEVAIAIGRPESQDVFPIDSRVRIVSIESVLQGGLEWIPDVVHIHALWAPVLCQVSM